MKQQRQSPQQTDAISSLNEIFSGRWQGADASINQIRFIIPQFIEMKLRQRKISGRRGEEEKGGGGRGGMKSSTKVHQSSTFQLHGQPSEAPPTRFPAPPRPPPVINPSQMARQQSPRVAHFLSIRVPALPALPVTWLKWRHLPRPRPLPPHSPISSPNSNMQIKEFETIPNDNRPGRS